MNMKVAKSDRIHQAAEGSCFCKGKRERSKTAQGVVERRTTKPQYGTHYWFALDNARAGRGSAREGNGADITTGTTCGARRKACITPTRCGYDTWQF